MSERPLHMDKACYGIDFRNYNTDKIRKEGKIKLEWLIELYQAYPDKENFFNGKNIPISNFDRLAGTFDLKKQIIEGRSAEEIRRSWEPGLSQYKIMRKKYLLYQ